MNTPKILTTLFALALVVNTSPAASGTWLASPGSDNWNTAANWNPSNPGSGTTPDTTGNTDIATFSAASSITSVYLAAGRSMGGLLFDTASASAYNVGWSNVGRYYFTRGMTSQVTSTVTNSQIFSGRTYIARGITGTDSVYTFRNDASTNAATFTLSGEVVSAANTPTALVLRGSNTGSNSVTGVISELNSSSKLAVTKDDAGTWILAASNTYTGGTKVNDGVLVVGTNGALGTGAASMTNGSLLAQDGVTVENAITVGVAAGYATNFTATILAGWDVNGLATNNTSVAASTVVSGVTGQDLARAAGVTNSAVVNALGGAGWNFTTAAASVANNSFLTFGLSATTTNTVLRLTTLMPFLYRSSAAGPTNATLQYSTNGGASYTDLFTTNGYTRDTTSGTFNPIDVSSGGSILQNVGTNGVVFRWVNYGSTAAGGTFYVRNGTGDDLVLSGEIGTIVSNTASGTGTLGIGEAGSAIFSGAVTVNNTATLTAATGGTATFSGAIGGAGSVTKTGAGTVTFSGGTANTYTGSTTVSDGTLQLNKTAGTTAIAGDVSVSGGATLLVSASNQVADSSAVTLSGGTIHRGSGVSEIFGDLSLTAASMLDFGSGVAGTLQFGVYEGDATPDFKLTVDNFFSGNALKFGTDLSSYIDASYTGTAFTSAWFDINSTSGGFTSSWNGSTFTITAIPEPSTVIAALALLGLAGWPALRRRRASQADDA